MLQVLLTNDKCHEVDDDGDGDDDDNDDEIMLEGSH